ncbi:MAG: long-chain fatty acid--CoA ligase [Actinomycetes bacterium]
MVSTAGSLTAPYSTPASSVGRLFLDRVASSADSEAFRGPVDGGGWRSWTWKQAGDEVAALAAGLLSLGLTIEDRVAISSSTRVEWILADLAIMCAGGANTTVYPSTSREDVAFILGDSGSRFLFAENEAQVAKVRDNGVAIEKVIVIDGSGDGDWVISWEALIERGRQHLADNPDAVLQAVDATGPDNLATLIYTSGTTGKPKGVELPHRCWTYEGVAIASTGILRPDDVQFLWLPLAHSFGKVLLCAQLQIGFLSAVDGRVDQIVSNLTQIQPTFMAGVPRIFEKIYAAVAANAIAEGGAKAKIFEWSFKVGKKYQAEKLAGGSPSALKYNIANKLVFSKIQERMGGRIRYFVSGSAALSPEIAEWFNAAGLPILEGYGLTETSAATCIMRPERIKFRTCGEPFAGTELKIAEDGEILVRGPGVMRGYRNLPDATTEVMLADGWFATGDVGEVDDLGRLRITDRKKDLVKTSGGKYIAPSAIESQFKALCPIASNMVVHVEGRNFASALITLDPDALAKFGAAAGLPADFASASQTDVVRADVQKAVDQLNAGLNKWETIKKFTILDHDFSIEDGELTPSLKVKRKVVEGKYSDLLNAMYSS